MIPGQPHHIEYYVNDLQTARSFWTWFLGNLDYQPYQEFGEGFSLRHTSGTYLVFVEVKKEFLNQNNSRQGNGLNHIAFQGKSQEQLHSLELEIPKHGGRVLKSYEGYLLFEDANDLAAEVYF